MCLAPPARVVEVRSGRAVVERGGARFEVETLLLEEPPLPGDWLAVQAQRFAVRRLTPGEAAELQDIYALVLSHVDGLAPCDRDDTTGGSP